MRPSFPVIDPEATGRNILRLRQERGLTVRDLQTFFGFEEPQAIYKWQRGQSLPTVDNLYALGALLGVPLEDILVAARSQRIMNSEQQTQACCSPYFHRLFWIRQKSGSAPTHFPRACAEGCVRERAGGSGGEIYCNHFFRK